MMRFVTPADWETAITETPGIIPEQFPFRQRLIAVCSQALSLDRPGGLIDHSRNINCHRFAAEVLGIPLSQYLKPLTPENMQEIAIPKPEAGDLIIFMCDFLKFKLTHSVLVLAPEQDVMNSTTIGKTGFNLPIKIQTLREFYPIQQAISLRSDMGLDHDYSNDPVRYFVPHAIFLCNTRY